MFRKITRIEHHDLSSVIYCLECAAYFSLIFIILFYLLNISFTIKINEWRLQKESIKIWNAMLNAKSMGS